MPTYASVLLTFDPLRLSIKDAEALAAGVARTGAAGHARHAAAVILIPTLYDGPDLAETAERSGLTVDELVAAHAGRDYRAYFLGFLPGFAYCGPLDPRIKAPRRAEPRERVPAGSVAIADGQTAVYPLPSPGGWQLVGRTATRVFDPSADPPALIRAGDLVRFVPA